MGQLYELIQLYVHPSNRVTQWPQHMASDHTRDNHTNRAFTMLGAQLGESGFHSEYHGMDVVLKHAVEEARRVVLRCVDGGAATYTHTQLRHAR